MKRNHISSITVMLFWVICFTSCKKEVAVINKEKDTTSELKIAQTIALNFYKVMSKQFSSDKLQNKGTIAGGLSVMSSGPVCGDVVITPTGGSEVSGDTIRKYSGKSIFTYMCNGFYNDGKTLDAYMLKDTTYFNENGPGYSKSRSLLQYYVVKSDHPQYKYSFVNGEIYDGTRHIKLDKSGNNQSFNTFSTHYTLNNILTEAVPEGAVFRQGIIDFECTDTNGNFKDKSTDTKYSGFIIFGKDDLLLYFRSTTILGGSLWLYRLNYKTGNVTGPERAG